MRCLADAASESILCKVGASRTGAKRILNLALILCVQRLWCVAIARLFATGVDLLGVVNMVLSAWNMLQLALCVLEGAAVARAFLVSRPAASHSCEIGYIRGW